MVQILNGTPQTDPTNTSWSYDPSNGTVSFGWIIRTNKGEFRVPGS
ncbi:MAG: hypothetical protein NTW86_16425 [Candidatus Sumerlaeota bacterium]|nr:hypothetical protein [Candidatus Sumerlaeota bacterium]